MKERALNLNFIAQLPGGGTFLWLELGLVVSRGLPMATGPHWGPSCIRDCRPRDSKLAAEIANVHEFIERLINLLGSSGGGPP